MLTLGPGLTVLTGETGAGKTMLLTGLGLLLGGKADPSRVRSGAQRAEVEGRLQVPVGSGVADRVRDAGGDLDDDGVLVLARTLAPGGRGRSVAGGRTVPASVLAQLADELVTIHGQHDQQRLARPAVQRSVLDRFGGAAVAAALVAYQECFDRWRRLEDELAEVTGNARERAREADLLRFGLAEVAAVAPEPAEDAALAAEAHRLRHAESLREAALRARSAVAADAETGPEVDVLGLLAESRRALDSVREHDAQLGALADRLAEASALAADTAAELSSYLAGLESDPARLAAVEDRRAALGGLTRKYGDDVDAVIAWAEDAGRRLAELDGDDERVERLTAEVSAARADLGVLAADLHRARVEAGVRFGTAVSHELEALAMPHATVRFAVEARGAGPGDAAVDVAIEGTPRRCAAARHGVDDVTLVMSAHRGAPELPVAQAASGGERSRVMLAVEVVLGGADPVPTFVFDEVDAGVGGRAAVEVGRRLARLARDAQVLVVTHLPQVAAFADHHLVVTRHDDDGASRADVSVVDDAEREREIARMLAGHGDSATALAHARELVAAAAADTAPARSSASPRSRTG